MGDLTNGCKNIEIYGWRNGKSDWHFCTPTSGLELELDNYETLQHVVQMITDNRLYTSEDECTEVFIPGTPSLHLEERGLRPEQRRDRTIRLNIHDAEDLNIHIDLCTLRVFFFDWQLC